jgi:ribonuclease HI
VPPPESEEPAVVYTDGACIGNPGPGGWAWAVSGEWYGSGFAPRTTNQRMELLAVIRAVEAFPGRVRIVSDSTYVVNCFRKQWWVKWREQGWRNSNRKPVANQDLWRPLVEEVVDRRPEQIELTWVKGHAGDPMNELVDALAVQAARLQRPAAAGPAAATSLLP